MITSYLWVEIWNPSFWKFTNQVLALDQRLSSVRKALFIKEINRDAWRTCTRNLKIFNVSKSYESFYLCFIFHFNFIRLYQELKYREIAKNKGFSSKNRHICTFHQCVMMHTFREYSFKQIIHTNNEISSHQFCKKITKIHFLLFAIFIRIILLLKNLWFYNALKYPDIIC